MREVEDVIQEAKLLNKQIESHVCFQIKVKNPRLLDWASEMTHIASDVDASAASDAAFVAVGEATEAYIHELYKNLLIFLKDYKKLLETSISKELQETNTRYNIESCEKLSQRDMWHDDIIIGWATQWYGIRFWSLIGFDRLSNSMFGEL
ncbi:hypothetical protein Syun_021194 [Stephania yunnanensis]|uniref:Uncharacterized protein n=1 Tax=Stephania yunnanensis TaxID=152371 RepID=A0AAP0NNX6_9MAGN